MTKKKLNKIEKPLVKLHKRKKEKTINKIRDEKEIMTDTNQIQNIIWEHFKNLSSNKLENLEDMFKFLDSYNL
jgi:hypothetical protein